MISSPVGQICFAFQEGKLIKLELLAENNRSLPRSSRQGDLNELKSSSKKIKDQLSRYFKNPNYHFAIPLQLYGTPFQQKVWRALQDIPPGKTLTYGELAKKLKTGPRAIGQACRTNPIPIIIPCHRVVAANHLGGYSGHKKGAWMNIKKWLLKHEGVIDQSTLK